MDGKELKREVQLLLGEEYDGDFLDDKFVFNAINQAALQIVRNTNCLTASQAIATVASQTDYTLDADFIKLYLRDRNRRLFIKYSDGATSHTLYQDDYSVIKYDNNTNTVTIPDRFCIADDRTLDSQITGTCTSAGAVGSASGEATLTDSSADFSDVSAGDVIHNTTDSSSGIVLSKTSSTVLVTAMFPDDPAATTELDWDSSDAYVIQPQGRYKIVLDPPPTTSGHTVTVEYVQRPAPVYANYRTFRFQPNVSEALKYYAAWTLKYSDREPNFGDKWYQLADNEMRRVKYDTDVAFGRTKIPVNLMARY